MGKSKIRNPKSETISNPKSTKAQNEEQTRARCRKLAFVVAVAGVLLGLCGARAAEQGGEAKKRFAPVQVFIDSGETRLGAYQFEFKAAAGIVKIVGIEGGEHAAYKESPYYDHAAMMHDRVIVGALSTSKDLPTGSTLVVTLHVMIEGDIEPEYEVVLVTAGDTDGNEITAEITLAKGE